MAARQTLIARIMDLEKMMSIRDTWIESAT